MNILVAIAIDEYEDGRIDNLKNCISDTTKTVDLLQSRYNFDDTHLYFKTKETTGSNIFKYINDIFKNALPEDNILLVYAGHGEYDKATNTAYWQPTDATYDNRHSWYNLTELISAIKVSEALHIGLILDSCYAGAIFEEIARGAASRPIRNLKSRFAITSGGIEKVKDGSEGGQSPFNQTIVDLLRENKKQEFSIYDLAHGVKENFNKSYTQIPMSGSIRGTDDKGGALIFELIEKNQPLTDWFYPGYKANDELIDQLFGLFQFLYKEVNFVPPHLITKYYPIRLNENQSGYIRRDYLHSPNEEVVKLFQSVLIIDENNIEFTDTEYTKNIVNPSKKVLFIIEKLNSNLIYWIENDHGTQSINITIPTKDNDLDLVHKIENLRFLSITKSELTPDDSSPNIRKAFANYLIGNIPLAIEEILILKKNTPKSNLLDSFILNYNLIKLRTLLWRNFYGNNERPDLILELDKIDLTAEYCTSIDSSEHSIIEWIYRDYFISSGYQSVFSLRDKVINHQKNTRDGGSGSNDFVWELIQNYAQFYHFIRSNYLVFEQFKEFSDITDSYIEGLVASHAVHGDNSKLLYFDDQNLDIMLHHGKAKNIRYHCEKYGLKTISIYKPEENSATANKIIYLVKNFTKIAAHSKKNFPDNSSTFYNRNRMIFHNALTISSFVNFNKNQIQEIARHLDTRIIETIHKFDLEYLQLFLAHNTEKIGNQLMNQLIKSLLTSKSNNPSYIYQSIAYQFGEYSFKFILSEKEFEQIFNDNDTQGKHDMYTIIEIWKMLKSEDQKKKCKAMLSEHLKHDFHYGIAQSCAIFGILELSEEHINNFITDIDSNRNNQPHHFSEQVNTIKTFDYFINISYHLTLDLKDSKFKILYGISDYYDWLLNIEAFDYTKFKIKWLNSFGLTSNYYKQFNLSQKLKKIIETHLLENNDPFIETQYMNIYVHKFWKKWD